MSSRSTFTCFGLVIHGYGPEEAFLRIDDGLAHGKQAMIVTANPEILLEAKRNPGYWQVLRRAELRLVDSFGLKLAGIISGSRPTRMSGVEFAEHLLQEAVKRGWRVAFIGGAAGVADKAAWEIRKAYPTLVLTAEQGGRVGHDGQDDEAGAEARFRLTQFAPDILLVGFGHPKQETWIMKYLAELPSVKIAIGVGGTLDYWSGTKRRAPRMFQTLGLEWLWRLAKEPNRWKRILNAVIVFPLVFLWDRISPVQRTA